MRRYKIVYIWHDIHGQRQDFIGLRGTAYATEYDSALGGWLMNFAPAIWPAGHTLDVPEWALCPLPTHTQTP